MSIKVTYDLIRKEYDQYGWRLRTKTFESLLYDVKYGTHLLRLLLEGKQLLKTGELEFPFRGENLDVLRSVRNAEVSYEDLMKLCLIYEKDCEEAFQITSLPKNPDRKWANQWLIKTSKNYILQENL